MEDLRAQWESRYREGPRPWDTGITPPEVVEFWQSNRLPRQGRALDMGGGTATNSVYLAEQGLEVACVEIASLALARGHKRVSAQPATIQRRIGLIQGSVATLPLPQNCIQYALDLGCFHGLPDALRLDYANELGRVMASGGYYQLYAFEAERESNGARGVEADEVVTRFAPAFRVVEIQVAMPNPRPCRWYLLQRR